MNLFCKLQKTLAVAGLIACFGVAYAASEAPAEDTIEQRLKPVGDVCMAGDPCAAAAAAPVASGPRSGEDVYSSKCVTCHGTGAADAPKLGDAAAWQPRLDDRGKEGLYEHAIKGFNAMPAKGLCMDCSDDEIIAAVDHMLDTL